MLQWPAIKYLWPVNGSGQSSLLRKNPYFAHATTSIAHKTKMSVDGKILNQLSQPVLFERFPCVREAALTK